MRTNVGFVVVAAIGILMIVFTVGTPGASARWRQRQRNGTLLYRSMEEAPPLQTVVVNDPALLQRRPVHPCRR